MTKNQDDEPTQRRKSKDKKMKKIFSIIKRHPEGLPPKEIANLSGLNPSTVRNYCRELLNKGKLENQNGYYSTTEQHHRGKLAKFHNVVVLADVPEEVSVSHGKESFDFGSAGLCVEVGETHHRVTGRVDAEPPVTFDALRCLLHLFCEKVERKVGWRPDFKDLVVRSVEANLDYLRIRYDANMTITVRDVVSGIEEKVYEKGDRVREEFRATRINASADTFLKSIEKGVAVSSVLSRLDSLEDKQESIHEDYSKISNGYEKMVRMMKELLEKSEGVSV